MDVALHADFKGLGAVSRKHIVFNHYNDSLAMYHWFATKYIGET